MRTLLLPLFSALLVAASPESEEAERLIAQGQAQPALSLLEAALARGDADAINYLASLYDTGRVVAQDVPRAASLYRRAAQMGQSHAQWRLGVMLDTGEGVGEDPDEAMLWIRRAADQGSAVAFASLGVMHANGRGTPVDYAASRRAYLEAARRGEAGGFYGVAILHSNGQGVARDEREGLAWMLVAATLGDQRAPGAAETYGLDPADTNAAAARAEEILREYGYTNHRVLFRNLDAERDLGPVV